MQGTEWKNSKCHFCKSEKLEIKTLLNSTFVQCRKCYARGPVAITDNGAVILWLKGGQNASN